MWQERWESSTGSGRRERLLSRFVRQIGMQLIPHNTQPWLFKIEDDTIELYADRACALPVVDPDDRELTISCGAALLNLRIALRHFGYRDLVQALPEPDNPDLLARIHMVIRYTPVRRSTCSS